MPRGIQSPCFCHILKNSYEDKLQFLELCALRFGQYLKISADFKKNKHLQEELI